MAFSSTSAPQAGHINKLYIRNFYNFKGDTVVSLEPQPYNTSQCFPKGSSKSNKDISLPAFIGSVSSGKTSIQNLISTTSILGYLTSNKLDQITEQEIYKREAGTSIFAAEVDLGLDVCAYYGIYSDANETLWNIQPSEYSVSCSSIYAIFPKEKVFIVATGNPVAVKQYILPDDFSNREQDVLKRIEKYFEEIKIQRLAEGKQIVPNYFISHDLSQLADVSDFQREVETLTKRNIKCGIFRTNSDIILHKKQKAAFKYMSNLCWKNNFQLILILDTLDSISYHLNPMIRFWKSYDTVTHAKILPESLLTETSEKGCIEILTSSLVIFVERESDKEFMEEVFSKLFEEGLRFKGQCRLSWMKSISPTIISTNGKDNIPRFVETLLKHAQLGLPHFVICDRDAAIPGELKTSLSESAHKRQKMQTTILTKGRLSLLFKCIMYLHSENQNRPYYRLLLVHYNRLANRLEETQISKAPKTDPSEINDLLQLSESAWREIHGCYAQLCSSECCSNNVQAVLDFCKEHLTVYPWACGTLEDIIEAAGCGPPPKKELKDNELSFIVESIINNRSTYLGCLLSFIEDMIHPILTKLSEEI